jgi:hypothetical protein
MRGRGLGHRYRPAERPQRKAGVSPRKGLNFDLAGSTLLPGSTRVGMESNQRRGERGEYRACNGNHADSYGSMQLGGTWQSRQLDVYVGGLEIAWAMRTQG